MRSFVWVGFNDCAPNQFRAPNGEEKRKNCQQPCAFWIGKTAAAISNLSHRHYYYTHAYIECEILTYWAYGRMCLWSRQTSCRQALLARDMTTSTSLFFFYFSLWFCFFFSFISVVWISLHLNIILHKCSLAVRCCCCCFGCFFTFNHLLIVWNGL